MLVMRPTTVVVRKLIELEVCVATQSRVNREYRRELSTHPCGAQDQRSGGVVSYLHHLGVARQEVKDPVTQGEVQNQGPEMNDELGGNYGVED